MRAKVRAVIARVGQPFLGPDGVLTVEERVRDYFQEVLGAPVRLTPDGDMSEHDKRTILAGIENAFQRRLPDGVRVVFDRTSATIHLEQYGRRVDFLGFDETHVLLTPWRAP